MSPRPPANPHRCTLHPPTPAAWRCLACERRLCEACAAAPDTPLPAPLVFCARCGGGTVPLTVPGVADTFGALLHLTVVLPVGLRTLGVLVGVLLASGLLGRAASQGGGAWAALLALTSLLLAGLTAVLLQASAQGLQRLGPEEDDVHPPLLGPTLRLLPLTTALLALPQLAHSLPVWRAGLSLRDALLCLGAGLAGPVLSLGLVLGRPLDTARRVVGLGRDTWHAGALTGVSVLFASHALCAAAFIEREDPQLGFFSVLLHVAALLTVLWLARLHGTLLHVHAPALGYALPARLQVPVAPGARPRGAPYRPPAPPPRVRAPLELGAPPAPPALAALLRALAARDAGGALAAFARLPPAERALLAPDTCVQLGRAAASREAWAEAREAFTLGTRVRPQHPATAVACVLLARLLAERLDEPATAAALYRHVVAHYPDSEAAAFSRARLGAGAA